MNEPAPTPPDSPLSADAPPAGRIDCHSHLLPGIDDGCADLHESVASIQRLRRAGFTATICTPHHWVTRYPYVAPEHVRIWTQQLREELDDLCEGYTLYDGGELRLDPATLDWLKDHAPPTLAESKLVLCDFWVDRWRPFLDKGFEKLFADGYTPVLAHPERSHFPRDYDAHLDRLSDMGVLLQGNLSSFTGVNGPEAERIAHRLLTTGRYDFLALDMHRPDSLEDRVDGIDLAAQLVGADAVEALIDHAPKRLIFGASEETSPAG
ncbi:MAG: CpsB/CapC family capsule biosynthesis tyrosine phosphatase [Planctomycetota bacterium]